MSVSCHMLWLLSLILSPGATKKSLVPSAFLLSFPKLWMLLHPIPLIPSPHHLCRIPSDFSTPLLSWLERTGHKSRGPHPKLPCQAQELQPRAEQSWCGSGDQLSAREPVLPWELCLVLCDPSQLSPGPGAGVSPACLCLENHVRDSRAAPRGADVWPGWNFP